MRKYSLGISSGILLIALGFASTHLAFHAEKLYPPHYVTPFAATLACLCIGLAYSSDVGAIKAIKTTALCYALTLTGHALAVAFYD